MSNLFAEALYDAVTVEVLVPSTSTGLLNDTEVNLPVYDNPVVLAIS